MPRAFVDAAAGIAISVQPLAWGAGLLRQGGAGGSIQIGELLPECAFVDATWGRSPFQEHMKRHGFAKCLERQITLRVPLVCAEQTGGPSSMTVLLVS